MTTRRSAAAGPTTSWLPRCARPACRSRAGRHRRARSPRCSPTTASSPGSRAAASSGRGRSGTAVPARRPRPRREPRAAQRRQGPRAVPAGRADGAGGAGRRDLRRRPIPVPYMLFVHGVAPEWGDRIPAVVHVDGTARIQTVDAASEPLVARMLERLRAPHRRAGRRQHQPQHRRPADGRRPARRAGVLRLGAGRPARDRPVRRAARRATARRSRREPAIGVSPAGDGRRRHPDRRPAVAGPAARGAGASGRVRGRPDGHRGRRPARTGRRRSRCPTWPPGGSRCASCRGRAGPGGGPQRRLARRAARRGSRSSTTTWCRTGRLGAALAARPRGRRRPASPAAQGRIRVPLPDGRAGRPTGSATSPGSSTARVGHRRHGVPARGARGGRRLRRALPAGLPRGRRPRAARSRARAGELVQGERAHRAPRAAGRAG